MDDKAMAFAGECLKSPTGGAEAVAEYAQRFGELTEGQSPSCEASSAAMTAWIEKIGNA